MNLDRAVLSLAGTIILLSVLLTALVSDWWLLLTAFVGLNLLQSSITGFCPAALIFRRLGVPAAAPSNEPHPIGIGPARRSLNHSVQMPPTRPLTRR